MSEILDDDAFTRADINNSFIIPDNPRPRLNTLLSQELINRFDVNQSTSIINQTLQKQFISDSPHDASISAESYLKLMSNKCPLDEIYKVVDIGYKDKSKSVCPVLVKINQEKLRNYYDGDYLLQCWDNSGKVVYQRALRYPHLAWAISAQQNTFMYVLDPRDEKEQCFHIVQLNECVDLSSQNKVEFKFSDWTGLCSKLAEGRISEMFLGLNADFIFVVATAKEIYSIDVSGYLFEAKRREAYFKFEFNKSITPSGKLQPGKTLHYLWEHQRTGVIYGAFSSSNKAVLDFYEISFDIVPDSTEIIAAFKQICELPERYAPIALDDTIDTVKIVTITHQGNYANVAVVLRKSENIDFYWDNKLVFQSEEIQTEDQRVAFSDIHLSFEQIYLRKKIYRPNYQILLSQTDLRIQLDLAENISTQKGEVAKLIDVETLRFFKGKMIHDHYKPFQQFVSYQEYLCVGHGNTVSIFNTLTSTWDKHFSFNRGQGDKDLLDTTSIFDFKATNSVVCVFLNQYQNGEICVYFQDGTFKVIYYDKERGWRQKDLKPRTEGNIVSIARDNEQQNILLILTRDEASGNCSLYSFHHRVLAPLKLGKFTLQSYTKLIPFFSPADNTQFLLLNIEEGIIGILELEFTQQDNRINLKQKEVQFVRNKELKDLLGLSKIHSAVSTDLERNIVLFDMEQMHVFDMSTYNKNTCWVQRVVSHSKLLIQGVHLFENRYLYVLYNSKLKINASAAQAEAFQNGFGMLDLASLENDVNTTPLLLPICDAIVGINSEFVYCQADQRIAFLMDYDKMVRVPLLHVNTVVLQGVKPKSEYLAFRTIGDSLIALDTRSRIYSWELTTGLQKIYKRIGVQYSFVEVSNVFEGYETWQTPEFTKEKMNADVEDDYFRDGHFDNVLIYKTQPEPDTSNLIKAFYAQSRNQNICLGQTFTETLTQTFHQMKLISIVSETQVKEVCSFVHPRLDGREQHLFFSQDGKKMIEIDNGECRLFEYQQGQKFLKQLARLSKIPRQLANGNCLQIYLLFSPDFTQYLDYELQSKEFVIRKVPTGVVNFKIPQNFLQTPGNSKSVTEQLKFMTWIDNETLRVIDISCAEPFEKIISTTTLATASQPVEEIGSTTMPFFDKEPYMIKDGDSLNQRTPGCNFFIEPFTRETLTARLKHKHQTLKRLQYLDQLQAESDFQILSKQEVSDENLRFQVTKSLFQVDYKTKKKLVVDMPFTIFHWRLIEFYVQIFSKTDGRTLPLQSFQKTWVADMSLNILPNLKTVLHYAANKIELLNFLFGQLPANLSQTIEIPFTKDYINRTPLHLNFEGQQNIECAAFFLNLLKSMPIDHHGKAIADIIYKCVELKVPGTEDYLSSRLLQTSQFAKLERVPKSTLKRLTGYLGEVNDDNEFVTSFEPQPDVSKLKAKLFDTSQSEANVRIKVWDIPYIHCPDRPESRNFCMALQSSFNTVLFSQPCVSAIIQYRWDVTHMTITRRLFLPYILYAISFAVYVLIQDEQNNLELGSTPVFSNALRCVCVGILLVFSLYFLCLETLQSDGSVREYLSSPWNYLDFVPTSLIISTISIDLLIPKESEEAWFQTFRNTAYAIIALLLCLKIFYFLRIFRNTGYFISMLVSVVLNARYFFLLYLLIQIAFYFSFTILTAGGYSLFDVFLMSNGQYNLDGWDQLKSPLTMLIFFVIAIVTINVVMLNILIAIVGSAYDKVVATQKQFSDLERLSLIIENQKFVSRQATTQLSRPNEYLVVANDAKGQK